MAKELATKNDLTASLEARGIDIRQFRVIKEVLYPNVQKEETLLMALDYCKARKLDIMKRPIQIVPIWSSKEERMIDTIWASIVEIRATATRTGEYAGQNEVEFGEVITKEFSGQVKQKGGGFKEVKKTVKFPDWGKITVYRLVKGEPRTFTAKLYWLETAKTLGYNCEVPNDMWSSRAFGQFEKCIEAAALRKAFPEEIGNDYIAEEAFANESMLNVTPEVDERKKGLFKEGFDGKITTGKENFQQDFGDIAPREKPTINYASYDDLQTELCEIDNLPDFETFETNTKKDFNHLKKAGPEDHKKLMAMLESVKKELTAASIDQSIINNQSGE